MGSARRLASRRAGPWAPLAGSLRAGQATKDPLPVIGAGVADPSQAQDDMHSLTLTGFESFGVHYEETATCPAERMFGAWPAYRWSATQSATSGR